MPKYIFFTELEPQIKTVVLRSGYRGDDYAFLTAKTYNDAECIITDHRNMLLDKNVRTSRMQYEVVDIRKPLSPKRS